ncbi:inositol monophosphatase family protein [Corynebacterium breve]|uniref:Inositol-1-monophosphatase n=1 Tax=Corynebacterium breve TaxID=3049799 RepID=A0ABY8VEV4_9CORY|nr:inositol monophosphatase family protein [Corynebacterium breve]WIM66754.1 inositol monophosphatase family protein [Corynebacterium breve]
MSETVSQVFTPAEFRDLACDIALGAGELVRTQRAELAGEDRLDADTKSSIVDPVTVVDKASEKYIVGRISAERPLDGIVGEEGADKSSTSGVQWIVDPIDGTVNFLYGLPVYAVSIGVAIHGELVAGAVLNVATGELYLGARGEGASVRRNGKTAPLQASHVTDTEQALVATGFGYTARRREAQAQILTTLLPKVRDIRRMGAAALDLCRVAEGHVDAYYEHGLHPWDYAAGAVIAREAGCGVVVPELDVSGVEGRLVVVTAPGITNNFRALVEESGASQNLPH